jgi:hypothetical protein
MGSIILFNLNKVVCQDTNWIKWLSVESCGVVTVNTALRVKRRGILV